MTVDLNCRNFSVRYFKKWQQDTPENISAALKLGNMYFQERSEVIFFFLWDGGVTIRPQSIG